MPKTCLIAVCHNLPVVYTETTRSLQELGWGERIPYARERRGFDKIEVQWFTDSPRVDMLRNLACAAAIRRGYHSLLFLDADMTWPGTVVYDMLAHADVGVVAGLYTLKGPPFSPVHLIDPFDEDGVTKYRRIETIGEGLQDVDVVGMGCTLIPVDVLRQLGTGGWFTYENDEHGMPRVSEDVPFCRRVKALGVRVCYDPAIRCDHLKVTPYNHRHHVRYRESVEASKDMGPLVTIAEPEPEPA